MAFLVQYNYAKGEHITRFLNGNDPPRLAAGGTGFGADGQNGIASGAGFRRNGSRSSEPRRRASTTASPSA